MPASSQQSPTSGTRVASAPHSAQSIVTGSIHGRCSSCSPSSPAVARSRSSSSRGDDVHVAVRAEPERQRQAPVALARDAPVAHVAQPVLHALAEVRRRPLDRRVGVDHRLADLVAADEPLVDDAEDQLRAAAPAVRVAVLVRLLAQQPAAALEVRDDELGHLVRAVPDELAVALDEDARPRRPARAPAAPRGGRSRSPRRRSRARCGRCRCPRRARCRRRPRRGGRPRPARAGRRSRSRTGRPDELRAAHAPDDRSRRRRRRPRSAPSRRRGARPRARPRRTRRRA